MKAVKKPIPIDVFDVRIESAETITKLKEWVESFGQEFDDVFILDPEGHSLKVKTREGHSYEVSSADVIIRGIEGEYYPCKRDIFEKSYVEFGINPSYDSTADTLKHIRRVSELMSEAAREIIHRGIVHDETKLHDPEKGLFDRYTPILAKLKYGSDEYKASLEALKPALDHHYANNSHHPEHHKNGVDDMDLFDIMEMFFDWKAATERTADGNIYKSIEYNKTRFGMSDQLAKIFENTAKNKGY